MAAKHLFFGIFLCAAAAAQEPVYKFGTTVVLPGGLRGIVYHVHHNTERLPDFHRLKPAGALYTASLNVPPTEFRDGFPGVTRRFEWFAIDYTGRFWIDRPGVYTFVLTSDDGSILYVDEQPIVDNDGVHAVREKTGQIALTDGIHRIRVSYFQGPRFHLALILRVAGPGEELRVFSTDEFKPPPNLDLPDAAPQKPTRTRH